MIAVTYNYAADSAIISFLCAQLLKLLLAWIKTRRRPDISRIFESGGMPSSHSATVVALATAVYLTDGYKSTSFAVALVLAMIVMYDAAGVRRAVGQQTKIINYMMDNWKDITPKVFDRQLKEILGHTPVQVFFGALLGFFIAFFGYFL